MSRHRIGTIRITRARVYPLDPEAVRPLSQAMVIVSPGEYPVYQDGLSCYWRMTGVINHDSYRIGDGMFAMSQADVPSDDDVVFYSARFGPDEWEELLQDDGNGAFIITMDGSS